MVVALRSVLVTVIHPGDVRNDSIDSDVKGISKQDFSFFFKHKYNTLFGTRIVASHHAGFLGRWATFWLLFAFLLLPPREHRWIVQVMFTAHLNKHLE